MSGAKLPGVRWTTAAPFVQEFVVRDCADAMPFKFDETLSLCQLPPWATSPDTRAFMKNAFGKSILDSCSTVGFLASSELPRGTVIRDEADARKRRPDYRHRDLFFLANLSLWLAKRTGLGFHVVLNYDDPGKVGSQPPSVGTIEALKPLPGYKNQSLSLTDIDAAADLYRALVVVPRPSPVFSAARFAVNALVEDYWESRVMLLWVGLEALFAPPFGTGPTTGRLLGRLQHFIQKVGGAEHFSAARLRSLYAERSDVVHGARFDKVTTAGSLRAVSESEELLLFALRLVLSDPAVRTKLCSENREEFLAEIPPLPEAPREAWKPD